jgi:acetyl-CoA C-acetyltransferase
MAKTIYVIDGARTPFLKARNRPGPFSGGDLAVAAGKILLTHQPFAPDELDEVILGCASPSPDEVNVGRLVALRLGCGNKVPGWTVMRNCASGMQALDSAMVNIQAGRSNLVLAGGTDALSRAPLLLSDAMVLWLSGFYAARTLGQRAAVLARLKPGYLAPVIAIMKGLTDPYVGLLMGQTAENLAHRFGITRADMDAFSVRSHQRAARAQDEGRLADVLPIYDAEGKLYLADDGVHRDSSMDNLAKLKPFFDRKYGNITPGNSSQITDGAAWLILASEEAVRQHGLTPIGRIVDSEWAGLDPAQMGLGPVHAATPILRRHGLGLDDSTPGKSTKPSPHRCRPASPHGKMPLTAGAPRLIPDGTLDEDKLNIDGGAIAWDTRSDLPAHASCCTCCRCCGAPAHPNAAAPGHRRNLHRRRPGRRDVGGDGVKTNYRQ